MIVGFGCGEDLLEPLDLGGNMSWMLAMDLGEHRRDSMPTGDMLAPTALYRIGWLRYSVSWPLPCQTMQSALALSANCKEAFRNIV